jgi:hypothetical protein
MSRRHATPFSHSAQLASRYFRHGCFEPAFRRHAGCAMIAELAGLPLRFQETLTPFLFDAATPTFHCRRAVIFIFFERCASFRRFQPESADTVFFCATS